MEVYRLRQILENCFLRIKRFFEVMELNVKVKVYKKEGRKKCSLTASLKGAKNFIAKAHGWKITDAAHELAEKLERVVLKWKERKRDRERGKPKAYSRRMEE